MAEFAEKITLSHRRWVAKAVVILTHALLAFCLSAASYGQALKITLLGTGNPRPRIDRFGPSILVEAGKETLLFDCGRGATICLSQAGVPFSSITRFS